MTVFNKTAPIPCMDGLLVGRFQPFHLGHLEALHFALSRVERLWVGLGSSNMPRQKSNPFSAGERRQMILSSVGDSVKGRIDIFSIPDVDDHRRWIGLIAAIVPKFDVVFTNDELTRHLYSRQKVEVVPIPFVNRENLSGTNIRGLIAGGQQWGHLVPEGTRKFLESSGAKDRLKDL